MKVIKFYQKQDDHRVEAHATCHSTVSLGPQSYQLRCEALSVWWDFVRSRKLRSYSSTILIDFESMHRHSTELKFTVGECPLQADVGKIVVLLVRSRVSGSGCPL